MSRDDCFHCRISEAVATALADGMDPETMIAGTYKALVQMCANITPESSRKSVVDTMVKMFAVAVENAAKSRGGPQVH